MGDKRKRKAGKGGKQSQGQKENPKDSKNVPTGSVEIDEDYVHYNSDEDKEMKQESSDGGEDDEIEEDEDVEMGLAKTQEGESDVEVTLDFYDPCKEDEQSVKNFLEPWTKRINLISMKDDLSKVICEQTRVGTTVKVEDDEAPIGFITCLNVRRHNNLLKPLKKLLDKKDINDSNHQFSKIVNNCMQGKGKFENEKMGLLVTERVINIPPLVIPKLLEAIFCEIEWAVEDEPTTELKEDYRFGWYLYVTEAFIQNKDSQQQSNDGNSPPSKKNKNKKQRVDVSELSPDESVQFVRVEDVAWFKHSSHKLLWPIANEEGQNDSTGGRTVIAMIIAAKNIPNVRKMVEATVGTTQTEEADDSKPDMET